MSGPAVNAAASKATSAVTGSKFSNFLNHPAGPKTIFFWAPMAKWALVIAGVKDMSRPAEKVSVPANLALMATGFIWVRYSMVITPVNYSLAAVNFFVGSTGLAQLYRVYDWRSKNPLLAAAADKAKEVPK
ncbi:putative FMP43-protein found in mitochondrial proteome [Mrakia frigida]|uniref:mitochondrial pyruvate carrier family protein n=1 Tax=Mrakia frigida TaxID=29902 RepID=UPI003FCBF478